MDAAALKVRMLGDFSIQNGEAEINDSDNRSKKVWLLLAYMIYYRNRTISQEELISLLWSESENSTNPTNALKTMFHRVRSTLNQLSSSAGHTLIVRREGNYAWNPDQPFFFDVDAFDTLCAQSAAAENDAARLDLGLQALALYRGDFLSKLSGESWVIPISTYFHNLYVHTVFACLALLEEAGRYEEEEALCRKALQIEPYDEGLYQYLMQSLLHRGLQKEAVRVYDDMNELLFSTFGIMPSDEIKALYRKAAHTVNDREISVGLVQEQLREPIPSERGALYCDYDFFKVLYHAEARSVARSGDAVHIGLLNVTDEAGAPLPKRSLDRCMENLRSLICNNLRRGDIASRCSVSQYIVMLPRANYENSCMVMDRIVRAFYRQYPHSPASLRYSVQPLEPML